MAALLKAQEVRRSEDCAFVYCTQKSLSEAVPTIPGSVLCNLSKVSSLKHLKGLMQRLEGKSVVCYEAKGVETAAQVWWLLLVLGFENVQVLDGGLQAYKSTGDLVEVVSLPDPPLAPIDAEIDRSRYKINSEVQALLTSSIRAFQLLDTDARYKGAVHCPASLLLTEDGRLGDLESIQLVLSGLSVKHEPLTTTIVIGRSAPVVLLALSVLGMQHLCFGIIDREQKDEFLDVPISDRRSQDTPGSVRTEFYSISGNTEFFDAVDEDSRPVAVRDSLVATRQSPKPDRRVESIIPRKEDAESQHSCGGCAVS